MVFLEKYKPSFTLESTVLVRLAEANFKSTERAASFGTGGSKEDVVSEVSSNVVLKARL